MTSGKRPARRVQRWMFWAAVTAALPFAYVSSVVVEGGAPVAEGCSGGPGSGGASTAPVPIGVKFLYASPANMPVDRDGFFWFWADTYGLTAEAALEAISVEVRNADGELVPGELQLLREVEADYGESDRELTVGWHATARLEPGQTLTMSLGAEDAAEGVSATATLSVTDETAELAIPELDFSEWTDVTTDVGEEVECPYLCGYSTVFGRDLGHVQRASFGEQLETPAVMASWLYTLSEVAGKGTLVGGEQSWLSSMDQQLPTFLGGWLTFSDVLDEYCVLMTAHDFRTDESVSREFCSSPVRPLPEATQDRIASCTSVPSSEYLPRWCPGRTLPECAPYVNHGAAGDGGMGTIGGAGGSGGAIVNGTGGSVTVPPIAGTAGASSPPTSGNDTATAGSPATDDTDAEGDATDGGGETVITEGGCGCRIAPRGSQREAWLSFGAIAAFGLAFGRRRARS